MSVIMRGENQKWRLLIQQHCSSIKYLLPSLFFFLMVRFLISSFSQSSNQLLPTFKSYFQQTKPTSNPCTDRYVYVYDLPARFNADVLKDCKNISHWSNMCRLIVNAGLGPKINNTGSILSQTGWFDTVQWTLEIIFHNRMMQYECLTTNYTQSSAVYIPFYLGLDVARYLWVDDISGRDNLTNDLIHWLRARPEWAARGGKDHLMVISRTTWDFQRVIDEDWGGKFLTLPEAKNMTIAIIESSVWSKNEFGIPYPTYFHPLKESEVVLWQEKVKHMKRKWLFSFIGARRPAPVLTLRDLVIDQCVQATQCNLHECDKGDNDCHSPSNIMSVFMHSKFCLQPTGDSFTRKSTFDSMLAGCIPVFFHPLSAYAQYKWYFPKNFNKFSVYIPYIGIEEGRVNIQDVLLGYSDEQVREMREEVIRMIPRLVYKDPRNKSESFQDAFDVAIDRVIKTIREN